VAAVIGSLLIVWGIVAVDSRTASDAWPQLRPGTAIEYRVEPRAATGADLRVRFTPAQLAILEKLNRADVVHLGRLEQLVVPMVWTKELRYAPFDLRYSAAPQLPKLLVVDQRSQAFAAYETGRLVRWGPVSTGQRASPTPSGFFHLNWRSFGRRSTVNPKWFMKWYFNFDNAGGHALHSYALPGRPASHGCIRLLERDAIWIYDWGEGGTPLLVVGRYDFIRLPPWRSLEHLAHGIDLPPDLLLE
jgi:hypothetical protein